MEIWGSKRRCATARVNRRGRPSRRSEPPRIAHEDQQPREITGGACGAGKPLGPHGSTVGQAPAHSDGSTEGERALATGECHARIQEDDMPGPSEALVAAADEIVVRDSVDASAEADRQALLRQQPIYQPHAA